MAKLQPAHVPSAWQVSAAMSLALAFLANLQAEAPDLDHDDMLLALDSETPVFDVLRRVIRASLEAGAFASAVDARMTDLAERKARYLARKEGARTLALQMLEALDQPGLVDPEFTVSVTAPKPKARVVDLDALPEAFVRVTKAPDMAMVNASIKTGHVPPGVEMSNGAPGIVIRTK